EPSRRVPNPCRFDIRLFPFLDATEDGSADPADDKEHRNGHSPQPTTEVAALPASARSPTVHTVTLRGHQREFTPCAQSVSMRVDDQLSHPDAFDGRFAENVRRKVPPGIICRAPLKVGIRSPAPVS